MCSVTLILILNRWPTTLSSTLEEIRPYLTHKVAVVDQSAGLATLDAEQAAYFDAVQYVAGAPLDELRNASLELARNLNTSAWGLLIDGDEYVDTRSIIALRALADSPDSVSAYLLPGYNYVGQGRWATMYKFRLIRLVDPVEFSHSIHESISPSLVRNSLAWTYGHVAIQHLDFLDPVVGKRERYKALLRVALERGKDLVFLKTLYAIECVAEGQSELAISHLNSAIALAGEQSQCGRFSGRDDFPASIKAQLFSRIGRLSEAQTLWERVFISGEQRVKAESALGLASIATRTGDLAEALKWADASLALWETADAYFSKATTLCALKERERAYQNIMRGMELNPMAGDRRVQGPMAGSNVFDLQCLLNPEFKGLAQLVRSCSVL